MYNTRYTPYISPYTEYIQRVQSTQPTHVTHPVQFTNSQIVKTGVGTIAYDYKIQLSPKAYTLDILA